MTHLERSMEYERAYSHVCAIIDRALRDRNEAEDNARMENEPASTHYRLVVDGLTSMRDEFRAKSDLEWKLHKQEECVAFDEGILELGNAIVVSAIEDYEDAISSDEQGAISVRRAIKRFAKEDAGRLTTADVPAILSRIDSAYHRLQRYVDSNWKAIAEDTKHTKDHSDSKHRCPFCGGGLYLSKGEVKRVKCTFCRLYVTVYN